MRSGTAEIRQMMQGAVPQRAGESRKMWLSRFAKTIGMTFTRAESLFYHAYCRVRADEYARLTDISVQISKVQFDLQQLHIRQGEAYADAFRQIKEILDAVDPDRADHA